MAVLEKFAVKNRRNMFVVKESKDAGNIFYIRYAGLCCWSVGPFSRKGTVNYLDCPWLISTVV